MWMREVVDLHHAAQLPTPSRQPDRCPGPLSLAAGGGLQSGRAAGRLGALYDVRTRRRPTSPVLLHHRIAGIRGRVHFTHTSPNPVFTPAMAGSRYGSVQDPRVVKIEGTVYMTYALDRPGAAREGRVPVGRQ